MDGGYLAGASHEVKFKFDKDFQISILASLCQDYMFLKLAATKLKDSYFCNEALSWLFLTISDYYTHYKVVPTEEVLNAYLTNITDINKRKILDFSDVGGVIKRLFKPLRHKQFVIDELLRFIQHQEVVGAIYKSLPHVANEEYDIVVKLIDDAVKVGRKLSDKGSNYFSDFNNRLTSELNRDDEESIPTGIVPLDFLLEGGGHQYQDFGLLMSQPNVGKTFCLIHMAKRAVLEFKNVVYIYTEGPEHKLERRMDRTWTLTNKDVYRSNIPLIRSKLSTLREKFGERLFIKSFPAGKRTVEDLESYLLDLRGDGFTANLLLVDYLEGLKFSGSYKAASSQEYIGVGGLCRDLKGLAQELNLACWAATHVRSAAFNKKRLELKDIGKAIVDKAAIADIIIGLCQTEDELKQGIIRMLLAKNRENPRGQEISINTNFDMALFYKYY